MSVYIKDMQMPQSCYKCPMRQRSGMDIVCPIAHERFSVADANILEFRLDNCPLIPVPDHGRLIDADALEVIGYCGIPQGREDTFDSGVMWLAEQIDLLSTIIPATKEGEA